MGNKNWKVAGPDCGEPSFNYQAKEPVLSIVAEVRTCCGLEFRRQFRARDIV